MQDKIQEIMGLVQLHAQMHRASFMGSAKENSAFRSEADKTKNKIQSKLRELVRESLSDDEAWEIALDSDNAMHAIRLAERAHNITNTSGEA